MKKMLIAGAASVALAAMPVVGVFAVDSTITDAINVTIEKSCTLSREGAAATGEGAAPSAAFSAGTYSATMTAGTLGILGTSSFTVNCNDTAGYTVTGTFGTLTDAGSDTITYKTSAAAANDGMWSALVTGGAAAYITSGQTVKTSSSETPAAGDTFTVQYSVGTLNNQPYGVYSNNSAAVYELTGTNS